MTGMPSMDISAPEDKEHPVRTQDKTLETACHSTSLHDSCCRPVLTVQMQSVQSQGETCGQS